MPGVASQRADEWYEGNDNRRNEQPKEYGNQPHEYQIAHKKPCKAHGKEQHTNLLYRYPDRFIGEFHG